MKVLGLETSCDDTGVALFDSEKGLLAHALHSQSVHAHYGGVVPELASRDHIAWVLPLVQQVLDKAEVDRSAIDGVAYTAGPGLRGALLVGVSVGRSLGWALDVPTVAVHHMEGHLLAPLLEADPPTFPFLALLVSGGHTQLMHARAFGDYALLGESIDDAAGEAFDKVAKLLGLGYPGGPQLERLAEEGDAKAYHFPRPMLDRPGLDFSFSGLKTAVVRVWQTSSKDERARADIAASFQSAVIDTLTEKCLRALKQTGLKRLVVAGGVSANAALRQRLQSAVSEVYFPRPIFSVDNGAMIAFAGCQHLLRGRCDADLELKTYPRWPEGWVTQP